MNMVEVKTAELIGVALDWAVAQAVNQEFLMVGDWPHIVAFGGKLYGRYSPSCNWSQVGPLIEIMMLSGKWEIVPWRNGVAFQNYTSECVPVDGKSFDEESIFVAGSTVLEAACRAIVFAKLGDTVQVPAELVKEIQA